LTVRPTAASTGAAVVCDGPKGYAAAPWLPPWRHRVTYPGSCWHTPELDKPGPRLCVFQPLRLLTLVTSLLMVRPYIASQLERTSLGDDRERIEALIRRNRVLLAKAAAARAAVRQAVVRAKRAVRSPCDRAARGRAGQALEGRFVCPGRKTVTMAVAVRGANTHQGARRRDAMVNRSRLGACGDASQQRRRSGVTEPRPAH
jgi:hypothetical protein